MTDNNNINTESDELLPKKILIIGGVAGGASTAARLRRLDEKAEIIMFERGEYISFANCGLPYYIGEVIKEKEALTLQTPESFNARFNVDVRVFSEVVSINKEAKNVTVKNTKTGDTYDESYDKLVISTGAEPIVPKIEGAGSDKIFTLRNIPDTYKIKDYVDKTNPSSAVVIGGGFIGVEMAENLHELGVNVTIVELLDQLITPLDFDMVAQVHSYIESNGIKIVLNNGVKGIENNADGSVNVLLNDGTISTDMVIMAIGVKPESKLAQDANLNTNKRGSIIVDEHMLTSDNDIFAVGDVVEITDFITGNKGFVPLAGPANKQGRIVADNITSENMVSSYKGTQGSSILKIFDLSVAATGVNEKTAIRLGLNYDKVFHFASSHATYYPGAVDISMKVLFEKETGVILGAQVVGFDSVDKHCDILATAIRAKMTARDLTELELCYAPPFSSAKSPVNMVGYMIENVITGKVKNFHWNEVKDLLNDSSIVKIDVRKDIEFNNDKIEDFINIPVDELRSRLNELDITKKIYITCQVGARGYIASRILSQLGYDVYNLSGGFRLYNSVLGPKNPPPEFKDRRKNAPAPEKDFSNAKTIELDACGLQCPGPILKLSSAMKEADEGDIIEISTTDPAFSSDLEGFCRRTNNELVDTKSAKGVTVAKIRKGSSQPITAERCNIGSAAKDSKNIIVFSGSLDKAIAAFIIANASAAMGRKVSMFFTFWGLNIIKKPKKVKVQKDLMSKMFSVMMPRGSKKLPLSTMNMAGIGPKMIRKVMNNKNITSLEDLIKTAQENGVEILACSMSMDVMGVKQEELLDGVKMAGAAAMLANAEESDMSLFV